MIDRVILPLTGQGDSTAAVATERIGGNEYQWVKLADGTPGETRGFIGLTAAPGAADLGLVVRNIPSGTQIVDQLAPWVIVGSVDLGPSTEKIGTVAQGSPGSSATPWFFTGSVSVSSGSISLTSGNQTIGTVAQGSQGSSASPWFFTGTVTLSSGALNIGTVGQGTAASSTAPWQVTGSVLISSSTATIGTVINATSTSQIGAVAVSSGTQTIGTVVQGSAGSSTVPWYFVGSSAGSSANMLGTVVLSSGTTAVTLGAVALVAGTAVAISSGLQLIGTVMIAQSSITSRTSVATSVDAQLFAANTNSVGRVIFNETTGSLLYIGLSTVLVSSGAYDWQIPAGTGLTLGAGGQMPLYRGAIRGRIQSTIISGLARMTEFLAT